MRGQQRMLPSASQMLPQYKIFHFTDCGFEEEAQHSVANLKKKKLNSSDDRKELFVADKRKMSCRLWFLGVGFHFFLK